MAILPPVCHPKAARRKIRGFGFLRFFSFFTFVTFLLWPLSSSRSTIEPKNQTPPLPSSPSAYSQTLQMEFAQELRIAHATIKNFLGSLDITQDELLDLTVHAQENGPFPYSTYQASFFLSSLAKSHQLWKAYAKEQNHLHSKKVQFSSSRPMSNFVVLSVDVLGLRTHELLFYFPAKDDEPKFSRKKRDRKAPQIAIVIDDLGGHWHSIEAILQLDPSLTLAILPHTPFALAGAKSARQKGHPVFLHLPMEPEDPEKINSNDFLTTDMTEPEMEKLLESHREFLSYCVGVNNHMGSQFTRMRNPMRLVLNFLKENQLFFLDSRTSEETVGYHLAREMGLPTVARDVFLDHNPSPKAISRQFQILRQIARKKGYAVAIGHPHPQTLAILKDELEKLRTEGFELVPVTRVHPSS